MITPIRDIERCFLSACLLDEGCLDIYRCSNLPPDLFEDPFSQLALGLMLDLAERGESVDLANLSRSLSAAGEMARLGEMLDLTGKVETTAHARSHFRQLVDSWRMRNFRQQIQRMQALATEERWDDVKEKAQASANAIIDAGLVEERRSQREVALAAVAERKRIMEGKDRLGSNPIETGIACIDRFCRPLDVATGDFNCILFAATSTGKSSLAAMIAGHNIAKGMRVAVFLGETSHEGLIEQMVGQRTRVSVDAYEFRQEPLDRQRAFLEAQESLVDLHEKCLWVYDDAFYMEDILARCRRLKREVGGLDLVIIDHLHCLKSRQNFRDERIRYNYMSGELKPLGKSLGCPVLTLCQPSRGFKSEARPPLLSDLKESGNLEDDADRIWALYLPTEDSQGMEQSRHSETPQIELHQLKFRRGKTCTVRLRLERRYTRFVGDQ